MKKCCVIGGTGFIGSHLVNALLLSGRKVKVIGRKSTCSRVLPQKVEYFSGDYANKEFLYSVLSDIDEIINLAYATVPQSSMKDPIMDIQMNLPSAVNLFETALSLKINKIIFISSGGTVYGNAKFIPISEDHPTNPLSPYGITKLAIEKYARMYFEQSLLPVICVRPSNPYGEGQRPFVGQGFIATAIGNILRNQEVKIYGERGTIRDYIYVSDLVNGIIAIIDNGQNGECYNIGSGIGCSNMEILELIKPLAIESGLEIKIKSLPSREYDVAENILDTEKIRKECLWKPHFSLEKGLEKSWLWQKNKM